MMNESIMRALGFGGSVDNVQKGLCGSCGAPIDQNEFKNALSIKEYGISGLCQKCQDSIFGA